MDWPRSESTSQLSIDIEALTDDERWILAAAIPILRGNADRGFTADTFTE